MEIEFYEQLTDLVKKDVWEILCESDQEFVPPLSARESSYQSELNSSLGEVKPYSYFEIMKDQCFLVAREKKSRAFLGFLSFRKDYYCPELVNFSPSNYITTICVNKNYRGRGITSLFYKYMEKSLPSNCQSLNLTTRTWSSNNSHLHILDKLGFELVVTLKDHRGAGIDTVYYAKNLTQS